MFLDFVKFDPSLIEFLPCYNLSIFLLSVYILLLFVFSYLFLGSDEEGVWCFSFFPSNKTYADVLLTVED